MSCPMVDPKTFPEAYLQQVREETLRLLIEARLLRRIRETVIANIEAEILVPGAAPETIDLAAESDTDRLMIRRDFEPEDFEVAARICARGGVETNKP